MRCEVLHVVMMFLMDEAQLLYFADGEFFRVDTYTFSCQLVYVSTNKLRGMVYFIWGSFRPTYHVSLRSCCFGGTTYHVSLGFGLLRLDKGKYVFVLISGVLLDLPVT